MRVRIAPGSAARLLILLCWVQAQAHYHMVVLPAKHEAQAGMLCPHLVPVLRRHTADQYTAD